MALINWDDSLRLGVAEVDQQHENIIRIVNRLDDATREGRGAEVISQILVELIIYTATHFSTEEKYFAQLGYPDAETHKDEHAELTAKVSAFANEFNSGLPSSRLTLPTELLHFLGIWWRYHILQTDLKFVKLFNERIG
jgi:hemerythrin